MAKKKVFKIYGYGSDDDEYIRRAMVAWLRAEGASIPSKDSVHCEYEGKDYVVLNNVNGVLAVYRVRNQGTLRRLKRWPSELEDY
jgi:hypothetical protein